MKSVLLVEKDTVGNLIIKIGSAISTNSIILPGKLIGEMSLVAAGSVVSKDLLPYSLYSSVPAKFIKDLRTI